METQIQQPGYVDENYSDVQPMIEASETLNQPLLPPARQPETQWERFSRNIAEFLAELPAYTSKFFAENRQAVVTVGLLLTTLIAIRVTAAVLDALNGIPLVRATFEVIGICYVAWFTYRYLLKATSRQELAADFRYIKKQVLGQDTSEPLS